MSSGDCPFERARGACDGSPPHLFVLLADAAMLLVLLVLLQKADSSSSSRPPLVVAVLLVPMGLLPPSWSLRHRGRCWSCEQHPPDGRQGRATSLYTSETTVTR